MHPVKCLYSVKVKESHPVRALSLLSRQRTTPSGHGTLESLVLGYTCKAWEHARNTEPSMEGCCERSSYRRPWRIDQAMEKGFTWDVKGVSHKEQVMERSGRKKH